VVAPVRVCEDLGERDGFGEGDHPRVERRVWPESGRPGPPAGPEPGAAVRFPRPDPGDVPGSLDAGVGQLRVAAGEPESLEAPVGRQDLGGGGDADVGGFVRGSEPALVAAADQRRCLRADQRCRRGPEGRAQRAGAAGRPGPRLPQLTWRFPVIGGGSAVIEICPLVANMNYPKTATLITECDC
jgi:hypothetical protein